MKSQTPVILVLAALTLLATQSLWSTDPERGRELHESMCLSCHDTMLYRRNDPLVGSYEELKEVVDLWQSNIGLNWQAADIEDVTYYLNEYFYKFECPKQLC